MLPFFVDFSSHLRVLVLLLVLLRLLRLSLQHTCSEALASFVLVEWTMFRDDGELRDNEARDRRINNGNLSSVTRYPSLAWQPSASGPSKQANGFSSRYVEAQASRQASSSQASKQASKQARNPSNHRGTTGYPRLSW
ncbi:hypothetical protein HZH66_011801 [Vespula vulgaris]|uniref:Secreted protein n=1 Tax=Vespula vulgaris TaxID=7454 RepID=A0A834JCP6_VESVU|nr:hypothetical protein HZH66_011801 [Vespula vulgaris]